MKTFFVVCKDASELYASKRYEDPLDAVKEAERLTIKERKRFFVMACFKVVRPLVIPEKTEVIIETCTAR